MTTEPWIVERMPFSLQEVRIVSGDSEDDRCLLCGVNNEPVAETNATDPFVSVRICENDLRIIAGRIAELKSANG